jgi:hypothetical protein
LFSLDGLEQCFEIAGTKTLVVASLDDFQKQGWSILDGFGEDLK